MIAAMLATATVLGLLAVIAGVILRRVLGDRADQRNIARLARRHDLDPATATRLYEIARRDGFGSAWGEVVEHPPVHFSTPPETTALPTAGGKPRTRKLVDRRQA